METETEDFTNIKNVKFEARISSIKTDDDKRDEHLKSADFFVMEAYPIIGFSAKGMNIKETTIEGELSIKNITKPVTLEVEYLGISTNENEEMCAGLFISGSVKRQDFGLTWNGKNEAGEVIIGDDIKLKARVSFIKLPTLVEVS